MFYINPQTGERRELIAEEAELFNALIGAIADQDKDFVDLILEDQPILAHAFSDTGSTALSYAATEHNAAGVAIARLLVNTYGANPYVDLSEGVTPIHYLNRIADQALKAQFGIAMGIGADIAAVLQKIHHEEALKIARAEVEAEYAAKKAADAEAKTDTDDSFDSDRDLEEYFNDPEVKKDMELCKKIRESLIIKAVTDATVGEEATQAIESLYSKSAKSDQLVYPVNEGLESLLQDIFGSKKSDVGADTKHSVLGSLCDWLGIDLSQLSYLVSLTSGSGFLPFYHGDHGNPDDDFGNGPFGGNSAVFFSEPDHQAPTYVVTILGNGTIVITDEPQQDSM